jgi:hypothetical protein
MKKLVNLLIINLIAWGCQPNEPQHPIVGDWRWVSSTGGIAGWTVKPRNNDERILRLTADSKFEVYTNNKLLFSADYHLSNKKNGSDRTEGIRIIINNPVNHRKDSLNTYPGLWGGRISELSNTSLQFVEDYCDDCYTHSLVRK